MQQQHHQQQQQTQNPLAQREKKIMMEKFEVDKNRILNEMKSVDVEELRLVDEHHQEQQ